MSKQKNQVKLFEGKQVRHVWDEDAEKWWLSVIDVIEILTESENPRHYWTVLKGRLKSEGNETVTNCERLKMPAPDGKMRLLKRTTCRNYRQVHDKVQYMHFVNSN